MFNPLTFFKNKYYRNKEMVSYWKTKDFVEAKLTTKNGHYEMHMDGENYPFIGFPRGVLLFGALSPLKHNIKNKIFNDIWAKLEGGVPKEEIISDLRNRIFKEIFEIGEKTRYDRLPIEKCAPCVQEIWRAMEAIEHGSPVVRNLKEIICFILQEDDAYRYRLQWIVKFFPRWFTPTLKHFDLGLKMLEQAEIIGDMKERQRLFRRVMMFILEDEGMRKRFDMFLKEVDWSKVKMTNGDKYFFRAKYFKVDYPEYQY